MTQGKIQYRLVQTASSQVVGDDDVGDGVEHKLDVLGVRGAGHVTIDLEKKYVQLAITLIVVWSYDVLS